MFGISRTIKPPRVNLFAVLAGLFLLAGFLTTILFWAGGGNVPEVLPPGSTAGGYEAGGLTEETVRQALEEIYLSPVVLVYDGHEIQVPVREMGAQIAFETHRQEAENASAFRRFWTRLWKQQASAVTIAVNVELDIMKVQEFLSGEIAARYAKPASPAIPVAGTTRFSPGEPGFEINIPATTENILAAANQAQNRRAELVVENIEAPAPTVEHLETFLKQKLIDSGFSGIAEILVKDLRTQDEMHFAVRGGNDIPVNIAFSAASTIKIPILLSSLLRVEEPIPEELKGPAERMIVFSENPPGDELMERIIGSTLAPLDITRDMQALGLENTFLAGYFYLGAPLLQRFETPANSRTDVQLRPDVYNQTTAGDMGRLLAGIYSCAKENRGVLIETFRSAISPGKCQYILDVLMRNKIGVLAEAGVPEGTPVAHKHGWTEESDGFVHTISDVGIVFSPNRDYVLIVFLYDPVQLLFEPGNALVAQLSQVVYNYYNPGQQVDWAFGSIDYR